ncbi:MAG TPA: hypothetical protein VKY65_18400 [Alphaproteobacteria bacterium]|nr:hypothetical protein [Alphaproteobacteria bacterium]
MAVEAAAALDTSVVLWTAPGTAAYAGAGWFAAVLEAVRSAQPEARFEAVLDCDDLPGLVLAAFRIGVEAVCFTGSARMATKLADIAAQQNRRLLRRRPLHALDLRMSADPADACRNWLSGDAL